MESWVAVAAWVTDAPGRCEGSIRCWESVTAPLESWVGRGPSVGTLAVEGGAGTARPPCEHMSLALDSAANRPSGRSAGYALQKPRPVPGPGRGRVAGLSGDLRARLPGSRVGPLRLALVKV